MNIFYHYTNKRFISGIKKEGLTKGKTPFLNKGEICFFIHKQWLTKDRNVDNQKWADPVSIPYRRDEYRIKINIPNSHIENILSMDETCEEMGDQMIPGFNDYPEDTKDWFVYEGDIHKNWIVKITRVDI